jgi:sugar phosphate isomerase/epimerase
MSIKSAVTVSLVEEAAGGPFIFWNDLPAACQKASELGFDAIELFAPDHGAVDDAELKALLEENNLNLAAVGTGAGMIIEELSLTDPDADRRDQAIHFVKTMIDLGGPLGAPAIIGSIQGRCGGYVKRDRALGWLAEALEQLGKHAYQYRVPVLYEPLNRYETNLINKISDGVYFIEQSGVGNVMLLADLFHMNIEEDDIPHRLQGAAKHLGHVHFVDSNRKAAGCGHMNYGPIAATLQEIGYDKYVSAEALPFPNPEDAAKLTIDSFNKYFR